MKYNVHRIDTPVCDAWIGGMSVEDYEYCYGGTRMVKSEASDAEAEEDLVRLMVEESHLKNAMINSALAAGVLDDLADELPSGYIGSQIGGGRCIMRPKTPELYEVMSDPEHPQFEGVISQAFEKIGQYLNTLNGRIKLTPDFGRFAGLADHLNQFTPEVLGVRCEVGGCGGKASYTVTGILAALEKLDLLSDTDTPYTLIGSDGALGLEITSYFLDQGFSDVSVCDLRYSNGSRPPEQFQKLDAVGGCFTDECLQRGGIQVMTTWGEELENSDLDAIPTGSKLILAHNLSVPPGEKGKAIARRLQDADHLALPGQMLTFGGALTSRLEWFWRQSHPETDFTPKKPLAHKVVQRVASYLVGEILDIAEKRQVTPFEAMWSFGEQA